uniref:Uncharacterized protein n=1 Tax=Ananas comosus var. bracteatus TaxID=296719 RepID=A0A6V7NPU6_ANACO|nr:unnamed protein product [Ananas comosus var. bracteatus]
MAVYRAMRARPSYLNASVPLSDDFRARQISRRNAILLLRRETLSLGDIRLSCYAWDPYTGAPRPPLSYRIWIRLVSLPYECWSSRTVAALVGGFGRFISADDFTTRMADLSGYRCLIAVNHLYYISKNLEISFGDTSLSILIQLERWFRVTDGLQDNNLHNEHVDQHDPADAPLGGHCPATTNRGRRSSTGGSTNYDATWNSSEILDRRRPTLLVEPYMCRPTSNINTSDCPPLLLRIGVRTSITGIRERPPFLLRTGVLTSSTDPPLLSPIRRQPEPRSPIPLGDFLRADALPTLRDFPHAVASPSSRSPPCRATFFAPTHLPSRRFRASGAAASGKRPPLASSSSAEGVVRLSNSNLPPFKLSSLVSADDRAAVHNLRLFFCAKDLRYTYLGFGLSASAPALDFVILVPVTNQGWTPLRSVPVGRDPTLPYLDCPAGPSSWWITNLVRPGVCVLGAPLLRSSPRITWAGGPFLLHLALTPQTTWAVGPLLSHSALSQRIISAGAPVLLHLALTPRITWAGGPFLLHLALTPQIT